ncbi:hypothetical protein M0804_005247 [Polistes exclamans]|nr:hypothetical protein M0804_005247 [Polistes exclamans]
MKDLSGILSLPTTSFGGLLEVARKSFKYHLVSLVKIVSEAMISCKALLIYALEIEAILNMRLITYRSNDLNDLRALTPSHFLIRYYFPSPPEDEYRDVSSGCLSQ